MFTNTNTKSKNLLSDSSLVFLLISNLFTFYLAIAENWGLSTLMWVYWVQSVVIGVFNFMRIRQLKEFSTDNFTINGRPVSSTEEARNFVSVFFVLHYGFFHLLYLFFLIVGTFTDTFIQGNRHADFKYVAIASLAFVLNHLYSYFYNKPSDTKKQNIGAIMFYPYARIIPMHAAFFLGFAAGFEIPLFLVLKTLADCIMHVVEHFILRKGETYV